MITWWCRCTINEYTLNDALSQSRMGLRRMSVAYACIIFDCLAQVANAALRRLRPPPSSHAPPPKKFLL